MRYAKRLERFDVAAASVHAHNHSPRSHAPTPARARPPAPSPLARPRPPFFPNPVTDTPMTASDVPSAMSWTCGRTASSSRKCSWWISGNDWVCALAHCPRARPRPCAILRARPRPRPLLRARPRALVLACSRSPCRSHAPWVTGRALCIPQVQQAHRQSDQGTAAAPGAPRRLQARPPRRPPPLCATRSVSMVDTRPRIAVLIFDRCVIRSPVHGNQRPAPVDPPPRGGRQRPGRRRRQPARNPHRHRPALHL